ncbi:MAG: MerR family transcriptional regulator [Chloroflexi bacterium]|nr:MerR family transcriptional regulator [Chloroflexota bacterium]
MYAVKQLGDLAGVSVRTLHYYDEIGLLEPSVVSDNGYRHYDEAAVLKLQQILFYRELGLGLLQIKDLLDAPDFDLVAALQSHRAELQTRIERLQALMTTVDSTILHLVGEIDMSKKQLFAGFSEEKQKQYEAEIANDPRYDQRKVKESQRNWSSYSAQKKEQIKAEGSAIYTDLAAVMDKGADSPEVQAIMARWHQHLRYFYDPTPEILRGLGQMYNQHPDFIANFQQIHPDLPAFLEQAVTHYCDVLEPTA